MSNRAYLYYIDVEFEGVKVKGMFDTGSTISIISKPFMLKNKINIPTVSTYRPITIVNGEKTNRS